MNEEPDSGDRGSGNPDSGDPDSGEPARTPAGPQPFSTLVPDALLSALESCGLRCDGRLQALNSFENRVYLVGMEDGDSVVAKFYRPGRWSDGQILEEHAFAAELAEDGVPVVAPLAIDGNGTLVRREGFRIALYPRQGGRVPELDNVREGPALRNRVGQFLAQLHRIGERRAFRTRPPIDVQHFVDEPVRVVLDSGCLPPDIEPAWRAVALACAQRLASMATRFNDVPRLRLHGDCHPGNLLAARDAIHFVDLDDCRTGPAIQDLWMLADAGAGAGESGAVIDSRRELAELIDGYERVRRFDPRETSMVEWLRTLRMIHYCGWLVQRRDDPAFTTAFPWFSGTRYWQDQVLFLREQLGALQD